MNRFRTCDHDDHVIDGHAFEVVTRRPSDPMSLCAVLVFCGEHCTPDAPVEQSLPADRVPGVGTFDQLGEWVEEHGHKHGIAFYE